jgi:hypothetical protein
MDDLNFTEHDDFVLISTDKYSFFVKKDNLINLKDGLTMHYEHNEKLTNASDEDLAQMHKKRPKRSAIDEINYQIERKGFDSQIIVPNQLLSRLPLQSQSRNRNGKQHIANKRWNFALKNRFEKAIALNEYYKKESAFVQTFLEPDELYSLPKGSWKVSPCHIYPALTNRDENSWTSDKICRDLGIMNKGYEYTKESPLKGRHAINKMEALAAFRYMSKLEWNQMSATRKAMYYILWFRIKNNFYEKFDITDIGLHLFDPAN